MNEKTRQQMRETPGLVDALVRYTKASLEESKAEDKVTEDETKENLRRYSNQRRVYLFPHFCVCLCVIIGRALRIPCAS